MTLDPNGSAAKALGAFRVILQTATGFAAALAAVGGGLFWLFEPRIVELIQSAAFTSEIQEEVEALRGLHDGLVGEFRRSDERRTRETERLVAALDGLHSVVASLRDSLQTVDSRLPPVRFVEFSERTPFVEIVSSPKGPQLAVTYRMRRKISCPTTVFPRWKLKGSQAFIPTTQQPFPGTIGPVTAGFRDFSILVPIPPELSYGGHICYTPLEIGVGECSSLPNEEAPPACVQYEDPT